MPSILGPKDASIVLKFGGGVHSRASENDIDLRECAEGTNFDLDLQNTHFRRRRPFDYFGTAPNLGEIRGFASLKKTDGTVSLLVQAGNTVYEWTEALGFTSVGTVDAEAKLRGRISHNWLLADEVLITDLNLKEPVKSWDGSTLSDITFTDEASNPWTGEFRAKFCAIRNERALFANIYDDATLLPHMMVGAKLSDYTQLTVANKPSSAIGEDDPFYLLTPDLRPINGLVAAFSVVSLSTYSGSLFKLAGASAQDFQFNELHPDSGTSGDESMTFVGNDIIYGRPGRIESVISTDKYGDVETDDISVGISDSIETFDEWETVYNSRFQRVYCHPVGQEEIWVLYKPLVGSDLSPWTDMTTSHSMSCNPTAMMNAYSPVDGLEYTFMGDSNGNVYIMEGSGANGDGGISNITATRKSILVELPEDTEAFKVFGWVKYKKGDASTLNLKFHFQGDQIFTEEINVELTAPSNRKYYGNGSYYANGEYYGSNTAKFSREKFAVPGKSTEVQIEASVEGVSEFSITEIGLRFEATS